MTDWNNLCRLEMLITEREAMIAENKQREFLGQAMAYSDDDFYAVADRMRKLAKEDTR